MNRRWVCTAALCGGTVLLALPFLGAEGWRRPVWTGLAVALGLMLPSYWTLALTFRRSDKAFYSTFVGGALFRLAGLAATAYAAYRLERPVAAVMLAAVGGLILLSFIELYFLQKEAK